MTKQFYKSLYFSDFPSEDCKDKTITLAFSENEEVEFEQVKDLSTAEVKDLVGVHSYRKLAQLAAKEDRSLNQVMKRLIKKKLLIRPGQVSLKNEVTFTSSKEIPFQRWYPYIEGYSPVFVRNLLDEFKITGDFVYEPFAGTGTTIFAADSKYINTVYSEVNPLLQFVIEAKIKVLKLKPKHRLELAGQLNILAQGISTDILALENNIPLAQSYRVVFGNSQYFPEHTFEKLLKVKTYIDGVKENRPLAAELVTVAVLSCLLLVSFLKKAGDVRFKTEKELLTQMRELEEVLPQKILEIAEDVANVDYQLNTAPKFIVANAKDIGRVKKQQISSVITSPPYLNGTNYFRNTKIELWFLGHLTAERDLRRFRDQVLTSGINDVSKENSLGSDAGLLEKSLLLGTTIDALKSSAYDKRIPVMAQSYFQEMYLLFGDVRMHLLPGAKVLIDIGDSVFAGTHIKTDLILIELLEVLGYRFVENRVLRKRRSRDRTVLSQTLIVMEWN